MNQPPTDFESVANRFAEDIRNGKQPAIEKYAEKFPEIATQIERLFPVLELMERRGHRQRDLSESGLEKAEVQWKQNLAPDRMLGDYRIVREIGRGGMGIVYEAQQESLGRRVALKLLPDYAQLDERRQQRFEQEARASANLHHSNIVPVFGVGIDDEASYIVMQFIDGQPLDSVLQQLSGGVPEMVSTVNLLDDETDPEVVPQNNEAGKSGSLGSRNAGSIAESLVRNESWSDASVAGASKVTESKSERPQHQVYFRNVARVGMQIADALQYAHSNNTMHRDIKPSNLLFDRSGRVWVSDFGLAKFFDGSELTRSGEVVGTLRYMSPEQLNGKATALSDVFSLGLTLYELACRRPAYDAKERGELVRQVANAAPPRMRVLDRSIPRDLETIVDKCLQPEPAKRYANAELLKNDLQCFLDGLPVKARRVGPVERFAKWCRRHPMVAMLSTALFLSLLAGFAATSWQWNKTTKALGKAEFNFKEADRQKKLAAENYLQARESVDRFFTIVSEQRLLAEPGFSSLRKELLSEALEYHKSFVSKYRDNDDAQEDLADSQYAIIKIESVVSPGPHLVEAMAEPIDIYARLGDQNPEVARYRIKQGNCLAFLGRMLRRREVDKAIESLQSARELLLTAISEDGPDSISGKVALAETNTLLGLIRESRDGLKGRTDRMLARYGDAQLLWAEIQADRPDDPEAAQKLAESHRDLGIGNRRAGDYEQVKAEYQLATKIISEAAERFPDNPQVGRSFASIYNSIGFFYGTVQSELDYDRALECYERSKEKYRELSIRDPLVIDYQSGYARGLMNAGGVLQVQGKLEESLAYRQKAVEIRQGLVDAHPELPSLKSNVATALNNVGAVLRDLDRGDESLETHRQALELHVEVLSLDPNQGTPRRRLIEGVAQIARTLCKTGKFSEAVESVDSMVEWIPESNGALLFTQATEYALTACKVKPEGDEELAEESVALVQSCVSKSKATFQKAADQGFPVFRASTQNTSMAGFSGNPVCAEILVWIEENLSGE